jgi:opacity protein-like surface antigen
VRRCKAILPLALAGLISSPVSMASDGWRYEITPYLFMAGMKGDIGVGGLPPVNIDASFSDIADSLEAGFMGMFTARNGPWFLSFDGAYMKLESSGTGPVFDNTFSLTNKMTILQGNAGYRVVENNPVIVDAFAGIRYTKLQADLAGPSRTVGGSESWADLVIGAVATFPVAQNVDLMAYLDLGGGGSKFTSQTMLGVNWEFADRWTAKLGYRYLDVDYEDDGVIYDVAESGPYLGVGFAF